MILLGLQNYIKSKGDTGLGILVAFSDNAENESAEYSEEEISGFAKVFYTKQKEQTNFDSINSLQYYRLQSVYEGSIKLEDEVGELNNSPKLAMSTEDERERLSKILDTLNDRWGTEFTNMDKVLEQVAEDLAQDDEILLRAHNTLDLFKIVYDKKMLDVMLSRMTQNQEFAMKYLADAVFRADVDGILLPLIHARLNRQDAVAESNY